ncbi:MAG: 8-amino-7-oxononanoate synthase [Filomicrobium sp.]
MSSDSDTTTNQFREHAQSLLALERRNRLRRLTPRQGHDFSSNDYLGLANSEELRQAIVRAISRGVAIGSGGSRLLRGNDPEHEKLEAEAAEFFGAEAALYFASGFSANAAVLATLPQRGDVIVYDNLIHASAHDGMKLSRAEKTAARHNDAQAFEDVIKTWRKAGGKGRPWLAVESLYSMDGDVAPLDDLIGLAEAHDGVLLIDEAHATGVLGPQGRGLGAHLEGREDVLSLHTCGKALGAMGGLVCGSRLLIDYLVNRCRPFIYSTAPSPLMASAVRAALELVKADTGDGPDSRRAAHRELVTSAGSLLESHCGIKPTGTHIQPVIVGRDELAVCVAEAMQRRGFDVRAIRPPTVPEGSARLRVPITMNVDASIFEAFALALAEELAKVGLGAAEIAQVNQGAAV